MATRKATPEKKAKPARKRAQKEPGKKRAAKHAGQRARALRLAAGRVAGQSVNDLARQENLSRPHTSKLVNGAEVRHIITDLVNGQLTEVQELFVLALGAIRDAIQNGNTYAVSKVKDEDGSVYAEPVLVGPDHYARLTAVKCLTAIVCAGRAAPKPIDPADLRPTLTMEQLDELLTEAEAAAAEPAA